MPNHYGRTIDNTDLSIDQAMARGFLHRDYLAHCLRWTHVCKYVAQHQRYKTARILDIGCGVDLPLPRMLYSSRLIVEEYVGLDYNRPDKFDLSPFHTGKMPVHVYGDTTFPMDVRFTNSDTYSIGEPAADQSNVHLAPTIITCFEVLEHVEPPHTRAMLAGFLELLKLSKGSVAFISTPCYDHQTGAAKNHVSETTYTALGCVIEDLGFAIDGRWGTFASQKDYKNHFLGDYGEPGQRIWDRLSAYYDSNYLATVFAPLYPERSRNCLWQLSVAGADYERKFLPLSLDEPLIEQPWTSSDRWRELAGA